MNKICFAIIGTIAGTITSSACSSGLPPDKSDGGVGGTGNGGTSSGNMSGGAATSVGGKSPGATTGGSVGLGGGAAAGGAASTGGAAATGGIAPTGGVSSTGGATSRTGTGGAVSTVGGNGTGGLTIGGATSGGTMPNTGGAATGGAPSTGGASSTAPTCTIDSGSGPVTYTIGTANSANRCLVCNPNVSTTTWTPDAAACGCTGSLESLDSAGHCIGNFETLDSAGRLIAKMVTITAPSSIQNYSIDVTEVTKGQYDSWLATNPALPASTDANCGYVTSYASAGTLYTGTDAGHHPVADVDWCDAYAYCKGVGKRLCGAIGGGAVDYASGYADATISQWYRACSSAGADTLPYGNTYQSTYCDGPDYGAGQTVAVGSLANCVTSATGFAGAYDLSGNVWEWEDSCNGSGQSALCHIRGGAFAEYIGLTCAEGVSSTRSLVGNVIGFRCCAP